jgi:hypothetical protein
VVTRNGAPRQAGFNAKGKNRLPLAGLTLVPRPPIKAAKPNFKLHWQVGPCAAFDVSGTTLPEIQVAQGWSESWAKVRPLIGIPCETHLIQPRPGRPPPAPTLTSGGGRQDLLHNQTLKLSVPKADGADAEARAAWTTFAPRAIARSDCCARVTLAGGGVAERARRRHRRRQGFGARGP